MNKATKFSPEVRERAVRLLFEQRGEHASQWSPLSAQAAKFALAASRPLGS